jgi:uncharacterized protein YukE
MTSMQNYHFAEVEAHAQLLKAQASALEAEHQSILSDVQQAADFWGGQGNTAYTDFVTELGKQFNIIYDALGTHGDKVAAASMHTNHTDSGVAGTWT